MNYQDFIAMVTPGAIQGYNQYGILPSVTIAQAILESSQNGVPANSEIYHQTNNLFGIKGYGTKGSYKTQTGSYRVYSTPEESIIDHNKIVGTQANFGAVTKAKDFKSATAALQSGGYAEDPLYSSKLNSIIQSNKLYEIDTKAQQPVSININGQTITTSTPYQAGKSFTNNTNGSAINVLRPGETPTETNQLNPLSGINSIVNKVLFIVAGLVIGFLAIKFLLGSEN